MGTYRRVSENKVARALLRGAAAAGVTSGLAVAAAALGGAGTANAACASIGGMDLNMGPGCTSGPQSIAVSLGNGTAIAEGAFTGALGIGDATYAKAQGTLTGAIANGVGNPSPGPIPPDTDVRSEGTATLAYGGGTTTIVRTEGNLALAAAQGNSYFARAGAEPTDFGNIALGVGQNFNPNPNDLTAVVAGHIAPNGPPSYFNLALNIGDDNNVQAQGLCNSAMNIFGNGNSLAAIGVLNHATNYFGDNNGIAAANDADLKGPAALTDLAYILQQVGLNLATNIFGNGNDVQAGSQNRLPGGPAATPDGPVALAGAIGVDDATVIRQITGIDIVTPFSVSGIGPGSS